MRFSDCHPMVNFIFYIGAFVMGMCLIHPAFLMCSLISSLTYYGIVKRDLKFYMMKISLLFVGLSVINPFFGTYGETVLFTYFHHRPYTLEALFYGMALGIMFVTILTWFASYNEIMTSDKFLYCFGRFSPSAALILTMVLRLVPSFQKKAGQISNARECIGKSITGVSVYQKSENAMVIVSALTSWTLEGGITMADSMKSRGFGSGNRTTFSVYRIRKLDKWLIFLMILIEIIIVISAFKGGMKVSYVPELEITYLQNPWTVIGSICYGTFLSIPTVLHIVEEMTWCILKSKI